MRNSFQDIASIDAMMWSKHGSGAQPSQYYIASWEKLFRL